MHPVNSPQVSMKNLERAIQTNYRKNIVMMMAKLVNLWLNAKIKPLLSICQNAHFEWKSLVFICNTTNVVPLSRGTTQFYGMTFRSI